MKEFKGTKGKWEVNSKIKVNNYKVKYLSIDFENGFDCVDVYADMRQKIYEKEMIANAKLIASAPELLEALQDLVIFCEDNEVGAELELAKEAINKAL